jgi:hypothetical protein
MKKFLAEKGAEPEFINVVEKIIKNHEVGGDKRSNLVKDADSISFLENLVQNYYSYRNERFGKEQALLQTKKKVEWMFNRISSKKAKKIAKPFYEKAMDFLNICFIYTEKD